MKNYKLKTSFIIFLFFILIFSTVSPFSVSKKINLNNDNIINRNVSFIEKSSGLNNPEKEEGNTELELADINNDGHLDIICVGDHGSPYVNSDQHGIMIWLGDGDSTWSVNQVGDFGYGGVEAGDLNLDGYLDIVWGIHHDWGDSGFGDTLIGAALGDGTASNWIGWAEGLGTGGEDWGMFETDLADFDCNGLLDIISQSFGCCNGYHCYENNGDGTWTHRWSLSGGNTFNNLETADFNSDGYLDFAGNRDGSFVFFGDGAFNFILTQSGLPTTGWRGLDVGDMNNDGCDDLVIGCSSSGVQCYEYDKYNDDWNLASNGLPISGSYYPQLGDINGDGFLDIVAYDGPTGYLYLGDGNGNWASDATFSMASEGGYSAFVVDGDFDHDGREDVVIQAEQGSWPSYQNKLKAFSPWLEPTELSVLVKKPNGGETFRSGSTRDIRWLSGVPLSEDDSSVEIQVSLNGESGPWDSVVSGIPNNGCYQWLVDAGGSDNCRIKIIVTTSKLSASAISASDFSIIGFNVDAHGPYQGFVGEYIQFTGSAENGNPPYEYHWDFGNGEISYEKNPTHSYDEEGNYSVTLSVTDDDDITIRDLTWALIIGFNNPPEKPNIDGPINGKPGSSYDFKFSAVDPDGDNVRYHINWGDTTSNITAFAPSNTDVTVSHIWVSEGIYTITVKAEDEFGLIGPEGTKTVTMPRNKSIITQYQRLYSSLGNLHYLFSLLNRLLPLFEPK